MPFVPDSQSLPRKSRFVPDARPAPVAAAQAGPFAGDALLSNEALTRVEQGGRLEPAPQPSPLRGVTRYFSGLNEAAGRLNRAPDAGLLGTLEAMGTLATGGIAAPILGTIESAALGTKPEESFARYTYQPRTESGKAQLGVLGALAAPLTESGADIALGPLLAAESRAVPATVSRDAVRNPLRRAAVRGANDPVAAPDASGQAVSRPAAQAGPPGLEGVSKSVPTKAELADAAAAAYKRADEAGVVVKASSVTGLKTRIVAMTKKEGLNAKLHPDTAAALQEVLKSKGNLTLSEVETLRKIAKDAEGSIKAPDKRLAGKMVDEIDDFIDNMKDADVVAGDAAQTKALKEARNLYSRKKKADTLDALVERAELSAPNFSASGMENALRTEFRALAKNERKMRLFTAEERAAIKKVAMGGNAENALRFIGKFAPTGVVSATLSGGLGAMLAGPAGAVLPLAGLGGRAMATRMTKRNVNAANELVRRGPQVTPPKAAERKRNALLEY